MQKGPVCKVNWAGQSVEINYGTTCLKVFFGSVLNLL